MKKIILIDGNSLMFRSYYATAYTGNLMQNKNGLYTNAIFGFCNMITKLLETEHDYVFVAFDKGKHTFRHQQYDDYKGGRKPMPEEFAVQIPYIKEYLDILNIKHVEVDEFEADDLIASVAEISKNEGLDVMVVTGDKDLLQLVSENVKVCLTRKGVGELEEYNTENFFELMGINSNQVPDYKGLIGDSSDNLPGIKGIGPKTASTLLSKYSTLEGVIEHVNEVGGKTHDLLVEGSEVGLKCKYLATLVRNIDLDFGVNDLVVKDIDNNRLLSFLTEMEFFSIIKKLNLKKEAVAIKNVDSCELSINTTFSNEVYIDTLVFGENYYTGVFLGLAILDNDKYYYITSSDIKNYNNVVNMLSDSSTVKLVFDSKKIIVTLKNIGIDIEGIKYDALLASYLINPSFASDDLSSVLDKFGVTIPTEEDIYGKGAKASIPELTKLTSFGFERLNGIKSSKEDLIKKISENNQNELLNIEMSLARVLARMESDGVYINRSRLSSIGVELKAKMVDLEKAIYDKAGCEFNINSVKQLGEILFVKLGLPSGKKNKTGYSTSSEVLEKLAPFYEIARLILDYRAVAKLLSTYVDGLSILINNEGFIHPLYKQALTATGRLSSVEPNIQNMPVRTELGKVIRDVFTSRFDGGLILSCDYSQIELRVLSHIANDENMIRMFNSGADFHSQTAAEVFDVAIEDVTKEMRRNAKAINFGIVYGMSAWGLSEELGISPKDASTFITKYFAKFPQVKSYLDKTVSDAIENGYTKTLFNRIRFIPEISSSNRALQEFGKRTAMNSPIQGSAADIIKIAMVNIGEKLKGFKSKLIAQVHDELLFDCSSDEVEQITALVKTEMENAVSLKVKLLADAEVGKSWLME